MSVQLLQESIITLLDEKMETQVLPVVHPFKVFGSNTQTRAF